MHIQASSLNHSCQLLDAYTNIKQTIYIMGRTTQRGQTIKRLREVCVERLRMRFMRAIVDDNSESDEEEEQLLDHLSVMALENATSTRYFEQHVRYHQSQMNVFAADLSFLAEDSDAGEDNPSEQQPNQPRPWLSHDEFRQKYRVSKSHFRDILNLIKDHPVFAPRANLIGRRGRKQAPVAHQTCCISQIHWN
jgi:hypothetical protein